MAYKAEIINLGEGERNGSFIVTLLGQIRYDRQVLYTKTDTCEIDQITLGITFGEKDAFVEYSNAALKENLELMIRMKFKPCSDETEN